jgi:hypothetical protein
MILAIDPGTTQSAFVVLDERMRPPVIIEKGIVENNELVDAMRPGGQLCQDGFMRELYIEMVASYGMAVGKSVFETCVWIGRFYEAWGCGEFVYRKDVKMHLCGQTKAKDSNIRQAIMDMYGSTRQVAIGTKKEPGPLYGVSKDVWAALGVGITAIGYTPEN